MIGNVKVRPFQRRFRHRHPVEVCLDQLLDLRRIEVTDRYHRHEVGPVPRVVEPGQLLVGEVLQDLHLAYGEAFRVARVGEHDRELLVLNACAGSTP